MVLSNNDQKNLTLDEDKEKPEGRFNKTDGTKAEQKLAVNPNPAANENISDKEINTDENEIVSGAGSEITDGEDG